MPTPPLVVTTSWDDGYPADLRLAEILSRYGIHGTFYVPRRNQEGRSVMTSADIGALSKAFEVGGHTMDHVVLTGLDLATAAGQIQQCKTWLEDVTGGTVTGFCYPRGRYNGSIKELTDRAGFAYARTIKNFFSSVGDDRFEMLTTLQFFPHRKSVYLKNFVKVRPDRNRLALFAAALTSGRLSDRAKRMADLCAESGGIFHLWGHSWELEEHDLWGELEDVLRYLSRGIGDNVVFLDNQQTYLRRHHRIAAAFV